MKKNDKNILIITIFAVIFLLIWTLSRYSKSKEVASEVKQASIQQEEAAQEVDTPIEKIIPTISPIELNTKNLTSDDTAIIDMRTVEKFLKGHIRGSIHINDFDKTTASRMIIFVTSTGEEDLLMPYYRDLSRESVVYNLSGGMSAWTKIGLNLIELDVPQSFENMSKVQFIEPRDLNTIMTDDQQNQNIIILDTRRLGNYQKIHIPGAISIPFTELEYRYKEIPTAKQIYIYGADDEASFRSGVLLHNLNFIGTKTINGGLSAWEEYGYSTTQ